MKVIHIILIGVTITACRSGKHQVAVTSATPVVTVVNPLYKAPEYVIAASGVITSSLQSDLSFKSAGMVEDVLVTEGQYVQKGQLLARLNTVELEAQLLQADYKLGQYQRDIQRLDALVKDTVATLEQLQNTHTALATSQAQKDALLYIKAQSALYAPASGIILKKQVSAGEYKQAGAVVFTLGSNEKAGRWLFKVSVSDKDRMMMQPGQQTSIVLDALPGVKLKGQVFKLAQVPDMNTLTYDCYVSFDPAEQEIVYGLTGKLILEQRHKQSYATLPLEAVADIQDNAAFIYTVANDFTVHKQRVHVRQIINATVVLAEVLATDTKVITEGRDNIEEGKKVTIIHNAL